MIFHVISIFPEMFTCVLNSGISARAYKNGIISLEVVNPRDFVTDNYKRIDDKPYGGGSGMVMMPEPLEKAVLFAKDQQLKQQVKLPLVAYLSPQGKRVDQGMVNNLAQNYDGIIFVCGRYDGIDERFIEQYVDLEISLGDFIVSGGELPAMLVIDAITRILPSVLNDENSIQNDSFMHGLLDYPQYTKPRNFNGQEVPEVLLSGNHEQINLWRLQQMLERTFKRRKDLLQQKHLTQMESRLLDAIIKNND